MLPSWKSLAPLAVVFLIAHVPLIDAQYAVGPLDPSLLAAQPELARGSGGGGGGGAGASAANAPPVGFATESPSAENPFAQDDTKPRGLSGNASGGRKRGGAGEGEVYPEQEAVPPGVTGYNISPVPDPLAVPPGPSETPRLPEGDEDIDFVLGGGKAGGGKAKGGKGKKKEKKKEKDEFDALNEWEKAFDPSELTGGESKEVGKVEQLHKMIQSEEKAIVKELEKAHGVGAASNGLDATCKKGLLQLISKMFNDYDGQNHDYRPLYAPPKVVNAAYKHYTGKPGPCKDSIREAVFSYPANCMAVDLSAHPTKPQYVGLQRKLAELQRRGVRPCLFAKVMCVEPQDLVQTPEHLVEWIERQFARKGTFWFQNRIFARPSTVRRAWLQIYKKEPIDFDRGGICARLPNNVDTNMGSLQAKFPDPKGCFVAGRYKGGDCRVVNVECLMP